jgi:transposase
MAGNALESLSREALIQLVLAQAELIERLTARVAELEARLGKPPKTALVHEPTYGCGCAMALGAI